MNGPHPSNPCACTALRKAARAAGRIYDDAVVPHGLTTAQFAILRHIARGQPLALSRLAEQLVMDRTSLYRALAPLEAKDWVTVGPGPGKSRLASLTTKGRAAITDAEAGWDAVQARLVAAMGETQWIQLQAALQTVIDFAETEADR
ncbi:MAG: MarR family winged helix-turn-helix transcriptional regulator [Sphingobium sp.]